jgi:hypothetical protein
LPLPPVSDRHPLLTVIKDGLRLLGAFSVLEKGE